MMDRNERKAAVSAYKERKTVAGVYAIVCAATGEQWIGAAPDLSTIWTRRTFALRQGLETNKALQAAWNANGAENFAFKILEEIDLEELTYGRERALKERIAHWPRPYWAQPPFDVSGRQFSCRLPRRFRRAR